MVLTCRIESGLDDNKIFWDREGKPLSGAPGELDIRVTDTGAEYISELVIARAEAGDFVSYGCRATNSMGYDYVRINLSKKGRQRSLHTSLFLFPPLLNFKLDPT